MIIFFFKFKKPCFWPISGQFPNFRAKKFFQKLRLCRNSQKSNDPISRKQPGKCKTEGWTDHIPR